MIQLTEKVATALASLRASGDFRVLMEWLKEDELVEQQRCVMLDGVVLHRAQGAVQKLQDLRRVYEEAPAVAKKLFDQHSTR